MYKHSGKNKRQIELDKTWHFLLYAMRVQRGNMNWTPSELREFYKFNPRGSLEKTYWTKNEQRRFYILTKSKAREILNWSTREARKFYKLSREEVEKIIKTYQIKE